MLLRLLPLAAGAVIVLVLAVVGAKTVYSSARGLVARESTEGFESIPTQESAAAESVTQAAQTADSTQESETDTSQANSTDSILSDADDQTVYAATETDSTTGISDEVVSSHAILVDLSSNKILAQRDAQSKMYPASMTKILTVLVAAEHVKNLDDPVTITLDDTDYSFSNDCSNVGFAENEVVTVRDLFYGTILPSGADAAVALATYVAGSQDAFVDMMNAKLKEMGLSDTAHVTNCVGIYDDNHYCTAYDMAMILNAAVHNDFCKEVLSSHTYTTTATPQHPGGITISNWFLRRIEDKDAGGTVVCAKTGYVVQSGNCAASFAINSSGKGYICVTGNSTSSWRCIYDHVAIYKQFIS